ncbi:unnamed protein product [Caenorhabditis auriculariae]|uniref:Uncharacterized protein n=1 Tax=Caenorhabditis auriculariae TaxID=2777116 RepID=A0A8S1HIF2_9PELO|nr:unnamed protein product [Caenorhabditis auriculariae]
MKTCGTYEIMSSDEMITEEEEKLYRTSFEIEQPWQDIREAQDSYKQENKPLFYGLPCTSTTTHTEAFEEILEDHYALSSSTTSLTSETGSPLDDSALWNEKHGDFEIVPSASEAENVNVMRMDHIAYIQTMIDRCTTTDSIQEEERRAPTDMNAHRTEIFIAAVKEKDCHETELEEDSTEDKPSQATYEVEKRCELPHELQEKLSEDRSSATSNADQFEERSFDDLTDISDQEVVSHAPYEMEESSELPQPSSEFAQPVLSKQELDHIAYITSLAEQSSFEAPERPPLPRRMTSEQFELREELSEDRSSATSNADQFEERSFDDVTAISDQEVVSQAPFGVEDSSELTQPSPEFAQPVLSKQELDHIAYITSLAEQSSFEASQRPPLPRRMASEQQEMEKELSEDRSSAISNADQFEEGSFDDVTAISDQEVVSHAPYEMEESSELPHPSTEFAQPVPSKQKVDHIAYITSLVERSSFEAPERPPLPRRMASEQYEMDKELSEDRSSATFQCRSVRRRVFSMTSLPFPIRKSSVKHPSKVEDSSELPQPSTEFAQPVLSKQELDHIAYITSLVERSSFEAPERPPLPRRMASEQYEMDKELSEDRSSATSNADQFDERSFDDVTAISDQEVVSQAPFEVEESSELPQPSTEFAQPVLSKQELDHIAYITSLAEQSSFEASQRPPLPRRMASEQQEMEKELSEDRSSAISNADQFEEGSFDDVTAISDQEVVSHAPYEMEESSELPHPSTEFAQPVPSKQKVDHIAYITSLVERSSFEAPERPPLPRRMASEQQEMEKVLSEDRSSATSNADQFEEGSFDDVTAISDQEVVSQAPFEVEDSSELPQPSTEFAQPVLSKQELDHIAYITSLVERSSFEAPERPPLPRRMASEQQEMEKVLSEDRSSATSNADQFEEGSFDDVTAISDQEVVSQAPFEVEDSSELPQPSTEFSQPVLSKQELDHIAYITSLAERSSFEAPERPPLPRRMASEQQEMEKELSEDRSSATSNADQFEEGSFDDATAISDQEVVSQAPFKVEDSSELPQPSTEFAQPVLSKQELDHIAYITSLAERSSFEAPERPPLPRRMASEQQEMEKVLSEDRSSATSNADQFEEGSFDDVTAISDQEVVSQAPFEVEDSSELPQPSTEFAQPVLSKQELDHIAYITSLAERSSFEAPERPPLPRRMAFRTT